MDDLTGVDLFWAWATQETLSKKAVKTIWGTRARWILILGSLKHRDGMAIFDEKGYNPVMQPMRRLDYPNLLDDL